MWRRYHKHVFQVWPQPFLCFPLRGQPFPFACPMAPDGSGLFQLSFHCGNNNKSWSSSSRTNIVFTGHQQLSQVLYVWESLSPQSTRENSFCCLPSGAKRPFYFILFIIILFYYIYYIFYFMNNLQKNQRILKNNSQGNFNKN